MFQELDKEKAFEGLTLVTVDVDKDTDFLSAYKVGRSTIFLFDKGKEVNRLIFETDQEKIRQAIRPTS